MNATTTVVAIPVRDEADRIRRCLRALDEQVGARLDHIVLLINNSVDATEEVARATTLRPGTRLHIVRRTLPPDLANAGHARRLAMEEGALLAGRHGLLMTTDADGEVMPDWLAATLVAIRAGADAVAGWVALHPEEWARIPARLHEDDARECAYDAVCDEIHARLDPDPHDPLPRHTQHSGASIAVTVAAFRRCGGVPPMAAAEDRALMAALRRTDARIRHDPGVHVSVSGRIEGRTPGGMADTIRRRMEQPDAFLDDRLEPAALCARRAVARAALRRLRDHRGDAAGLVQDLVQHLELPAASLRAALAASFFGMAWDTVERAAPALCRKPVAVADLPREMDAAEAILARLRDRDDRAGSAPLAPEAMV